MMICKTCAKEITMGQRYFREEAGSYVLYVHSECIPNNKPKEAVIHPDHYNAGKIECIDALEAATVNLKGIEAFYTANIIKYMWRWKQKSGLEDLNKAANYLQMLIKKVEGTRPDDPLYTGEVDPKWRSS